MNAPVTISKASVEHTQPLVDLIQSAYRGDTSRQGWTSEADLIDGPRIMFEEMKATILDSDEYVLLAHDRDGRLIGCAAVAKESESTCSFGKFAVSPVLQGAGTGRALLEASEDIARTHFGAKRMVLTVIEGRSELEAYYERRGYARTANVVKLADVFQGEIISRGMDLILNEFAKPL
jgi:GNAT superfamily N-acetyltransferase